MTTLGRLRAARAIWERVLLVIVLLTIVLPPAVQAQMPPPAAAKGQEDSLAEMPEPPLADSLQREVLKGVWRLPLAAALGTILALRPRRRGTPVRQMAVVETQIILAVVGALIMLVVGSSLARAFGIVGAANLIRYRSKIDDPKDAVVMLSALAVGLAAGVGLYGLGIFATVFLALALWIIEGFEPKTRVFELSVKLGDKTAELQSRIETILKRHKAEYELRSQSEEEVCYFVTVPFDVQTDRVANQLTALVPSGHGAVEWSEKSKSKAESSVRVVLIIQPEASVAAVTQALRKARKQIDICIFRFDVAEIERALTAAVQRGVRVRALIAHTNRGGDSHLRMLEQRLLADGVTVSRTADDLLRYHAKYMIADDVLHVFGFNFTKLDIHKSRSFGISTRDRKAVAEAAKLFEADSTRQSFTPASSNLVVSPETSRDVLTRFVRGAKQELAIYDNKLTDPAFVKLLRDRAKAGVRVRVLGTMKKVDSGIEVRKFKPMRLHVRAIIRDGSSAFVGSLSLRTEELDSRREVGLIVNNPRMTRKILQVFELDWRDSSAGEPEITGDEMSSDDPGLDDGLESPAL